MTATAFVFPGQGSQSIGMLGDIALSYPEIKNTFNEASRILDYDLWELIQVGPAEELDKTMHTQPALLTASYALWKILNPKPLLLAGHSLGEYTALTCANAISFKDAVQLVAARGRFMQEALTNDTGALAAIVGLSNEIVSEICVKATLSGEVLTPANYNSPGQVVVAGHKIAVERCLILAKAAGAKLAKILPVSVPSHCRLMQPAAEKLSLFLKTLSIIPPSIPVLNNVDVELYHDENSIREGLVRQLTLPVRWVEIIEKMQKQGISQIVECGPGKVLTGLNKRIVPELQLANTVDLASLNVLRA